MNSYDFSEEAEKPADLSQKIVFKVKRKDKTAKPAEKDQQEISPERSRKSGKSKKKKEPAKNLLSFEDEEDDDE